MGKNCLDDMCQDLKECVGQQLIEASYQVEEVAKEVGSEVQQQSCDLVVCKAVEAALLFGGSALCKGMNSAVGCKDKFVNMDQLLTRKGCA